MQEDRPGPGRRADAGPTSDDVHRLEEALRDRSRRLTAALDEARARRLEATAQAERAQRAEAERARAVGELERLRNKAPVRALLALRRVGRQATRATASFRVIRERSGAIPRGERRLRASRDEERALRARLLATLPGEPPVTGPHVSVIVVNRDGLHHLRRLLPALAATAYSNIDLTLVDNASTDGSLSWARGTAMPFPVRFIENSDNRSFAAANNTAARDADGELVLFLHNDVIPVEPGWLGYLVDALASTGAVAAGARLVYPRRDGPRSGPQEQPADLDLQHLGITFDWVHGMPRPRSIGGPDAGDPGLANVRDVVAATAACLLVRRDRFLAAGSFDETYVDGYEDVDLALRWREAGERLIVDGRAVLWHSESATRRIQRGGRTPERQHENLRAFNGRWGVRLFREALEEASTGERTLTSEAPGLVVVGAGNDDEVAVLVNGLEELGWRVTRSTGPRQSAGDAAGAAASDAAVVALLVDPNVDIRELPRHAVTIGWVRGDPEPWTATPWRDEFDLVVASDATSADAITAAGAKRAGVLAEPTAGHLVALIREWVAALRATVLVQARDWVEAPNSGDYHFARALQRQLERRGIPTTVHLRPGWGQGASSRDDLAIHLWGRYPVGRRPGQTAILWVLYHPELVTDELVADYDLVLVASDRFAAKLSERTGRPVHAVHQATDPERFHPGVGGPVHELLFVGNSRGTRRRILDSLVGTPHDLAVYGRGWDPELLDPIHLRGDGVSNETLAGHYESAAIVLNDHWPEAAAEGFINNRIYDALAAGGFVVSDHVEGIEAEFDEGVVTYRDEPDLLRLVERLLADPARRAASATRGRAAVLARHTFEHRVDEILGLPGLAGTPRR